MVQGVKEVYMAGAVVHNRTRYLAGCRCDVCKRAQSEYRRNRRLAQNAAKVSGAVTSVAPTAPVVKLAPRPAAPEVPAQSAHAVREPGPVEAGVLAEIEPLPAFSGRPGLVQLALALARVLDSPGALPQHASSAHRLSETLDKLRRGADSRASKLASVQRMTGSRKATG